MFYLTEAQSEIMCLLIFIIMKITSKYTSTLSIHRIIWLNMTKNLHVVFLIFNVIWIITANIALLQQMSLFVRFHLTWKKIKSVWLSTQSGQLCSDLPYGQKAKTRDSSFSYSCWTHHTKNCLYSCSSSTNRLKLYEKCQENLTY